MGEGCDRGKQTDRRRGGQREQKVGRRNEEGAAKARRLSKTGDPGVSVKGATEIQIFVAWLARQQDSQHIY